MKKKNGFTLLEIIITLALISIAAAMVLPYLSTALTQSGASMWRLRDSLALRQVMENITQDYQAITLSTLRTNIGSEGTSQANNYGTYQVIRNRYIQFSGNTEQAGGSTLLKVTIAGNGGEQLTTLFYKRD